MARKLIRNNFRIFVPPPNWGRILTKKSNFFQIGQNGEKIGQQLFFLILDPRPHFGPNKFGQKWKKSNLFQIGWNAEKIGQKLVSEFWTPNLGRRKFGHKIQTCSKLAEMARKLVGNNFFGNPPPPSRNWGLKKLVLWKNQICSKLDEMTRKVVRNYFRILDPPNSPLPPPTYNGGIRRQFYLG